MYLKVIEIDHPENIRFIPRLLSFNGNSDSDIFNEMLEKALTIMETPEGKEYLYYNFSCLLYTSPSPRDGLLSRMPSSA